MIIAVKLVLDQYINEQNNTAAYFIGPGIKLQS